MNDHDLKEYMKPIYKRQGRAIVVAIVILITSLIINVL
jgi:hypothetical protein